MHRKDLCRTYGASEILFGISQTFRSRLASAAPLALMRETVIEPRPMVNSELFRKG